MNETLKTRHAGVEAWRPVTLGIGSSLSLSKRVKFVQPRSSQKPVSFSTKTLSSFCTKSASTPRLPNSVKGERYRSRSVMNSGTGNQWRLPVYSQTPQVCCLFYTTHVIHIGWVKCLDSTSFLVLGYCCVKYASGKLLLQFLRSKNAPI